MKTQKLWGVNFLLSDLDNYLIYLEKKLSEDKKIILTGINPYSLSTIKKNPLMLDALKITTIANVDGILLKYALQLLGFSVPMRLDTPSIFHRLMKTAVQKKLRVFLLGSKSEDLPLIKKRMKETFPGIIIAGSHHGYFAKADETLIVDEINQKKVDVLILGMPSPKKEIFVYDQCDKMNFKVSLGVGGVFDILAGKKQPAPSIIKRMNIEWLYRFAQEPQRLLVRYKDMLLYFSWFILKNKAKENASV